MTIDELIIVKVDGSPEDIERTAYQILHLFLDADVSWTVEVLRRTGWICDYNQTAERVLEEFEEFKVEDQFKLAMDLCFAGDVYAPE